MKIHIAKPEDAKRLGYAHWIGSLKQPGSFMYQLGKHFLQQYYRILLNERHSVILCAEDEEGNLLGFVSGSLDAQKGMEALRKHRLNLLIATFPALIHNPALIREAYNRQNSESANQAEIGYVVKSGAHEDFWAWLPKTTSGAIELHLKWLALMRLLGANLVYGEVDPVNELVLKTHRLCGARIVKKFFTPDGKQRLLIEYRLEDSQKIVREKVYQ